MKDTQQIWNQFQKSLLSFIQRRVNDLDDAQDILQIVFEKIHRKQDQLAGMRQPGAWVYRITRNTIIDFYRKERQGTKAPVEFDLQELPMQDVTDEYDNQELMQFLNECMAGFMLGISAEDQQLLTAHQKGLSLKHIAQDRKQSYATIKSRVSRAREKIRRRFVDCCQIHSLQHDPASIQKNCAC